MAKPYSQDLRDRVIDAVKRGEMSRRAAARRYEISASVAIKWLERVERDGSREPVGHGGHRASKLMPHRDFLEAARAEKSDVTLQALCDRLSAERGVKADTSMMSRFFRRIGVTVKKDPCRTRAGSPGHQSPPQTMANLTWGALGQERIHSGMCQTPRAVSVSEVRARLHDAARFRARSTSHTVAARDGCTNIPLAAGRGSGDETILSIGMSGHGYHRFRPPGSARTDQVLGDLIIC